MTTLPDQSPQMAALIQNLIKDVTTLRAETLHQTEKILSQLAHLSAQQPPLLTTQCPTPVQPELQSTFPAPPPTSTPPPTASKETLHKHLGIHWSEATYPDSKPTPIFSNTVKLAASSRRASLASGSLVSNASLSEVSSGSLVGQYARFRDSTFGRGGVGGGRKGVRNSVIAVGSLRNSVAGIGGVGKLRGTRNTAARPVSWLQYTTAAHEAVVGASRLGVEVSNGNEEGDVEEGCMTEVARDVHETPVESVEKFEVLVSKSVSGTVEDLAETTKNDSGTPPARATISTASVKEEALSWWKLLFLIPAFDGKGASLKVNDFNKTDFESVAFPENGFHPRSYFITWWDFVISGLFLVFLWEIPFIATYGRDFPVTDTSFWTVFITAVFICDTIVNSATPNPSAVNPHCTLMEFEAQRPNLKGWMYRWAYRQLPVDILSMIPFELLATRWPHSQTLVLIRCLRLYRLPSRITHCAIVKRLTAVVDKTAGLPICNIIPIAVGIFYFLHLNACAMYFFGSIKGFVGWSAVFPHITEATLFEFYSWTFYQAVGNMFPINFTPQTELEQIVAAVFIVSAAILYGAFLGSISSTTMSINPSGRLYNQKMEELNEYVKWKNLSFETEQKLLSYYEVKYRGKYFEEDTLLADMNDSLRAEIVLHNTRWLIEKVPFLRRSENDGRDEIFFSRIASKLHANYFTPGDFITKQGESAMDMYFVLSGKCDVYVGGRKVVSLYDGAYFGEVALICSILRTASVQAAMHSVLYRLTYTDFHLVLNEFPDVKARIAALAAEKEAAFKLQTNTSLTATCQPVVKD